MAGKVLDGVASDPGDRSGLMVGAPPPPGSAFAARADHMRFPMIRWS